MQQSTSANVTQLFTLKMSVHQRVALLYFNSIPLPVGLLLSLVNLFVVSGCAQLPPSTEKTTQTPKPEVEAIIPEPSSPINITPPVMPHSQDNKPTAATSPSATQPVNNHIREDNTYVSAAKKNLWVWLGQQLKWQNINNNRIIRQQKRFIRNTHYIKRVLQRGTPYIYYITHELKNNDLPLELALLPVVESAYRPFAYSHGRATGIWQFIPSTGKLFGLKQNWWYDGRRDIVTSTNAAIRFFKQLEVEFNGNWLHVLAAYNAGPTKVRQAIKHNQKKGLPISYWDLPLPRETLNYVPKLLALVKIVQHPQKYGLDLPQADPAPYFAKVDTRKQIDLSRAAEMANMSIEQLYLLNPGFNRWATAPDGPHRLLIPVDHAKQFALKLSKLPDSERIAWTRHTIEPGETLSTIAQRYKTTTRYIKKVNRLNSNLIQAGKALTIPVPGTTESSYLYSTSERLKKVQSQGSGTRRVHQVRKGDTLWDLAKTYNSSVRKIAKWNNIAPKTPLKLGQMLVIWQKTSPEAITISSINAPSQNFQPAIQTIRYTVKSGDSLDGIAHKFNIKVVDLFKWNENLKNTKYIHPGQKIRLKLDIREQSG